MFIPILALFVGLVLGYTLACICFVSGRANLEQENMELRNRLEKYEEIS